MVNCSIVTYLTPEEMLMKVLKSVLLSNTIGKLFIVDNSPTDEIRSLLPNDPRIVYIPNPANTGFGAGHNIALKQSLSEGIAYHLVLNPDVFFVEGTLEKIVDYMDGNLDIGNLLPKVIYPDGSLQFLCKLLPTPYDWIGRRFNPIKSIVDKRNNLFELKFSGYNNVMEVPYMSGCFMFLRVSAIEKVGLYDENIFMYGEETDLCRRLISGGYKTVFYPDSEIIHEFQKGSHKSFKLTWVGIKSAIYYFNKWGWFFDKERKQINAKTLSLLNYRKK